VPIVVLGSHDGVGVGLYRSLARPGANVTGIDSSAREMDAKRLEILTSMVPTVRHVAVLYDPDVPGVTRYVQTLRTTIDKAGIRAVDAPAASADAIGPALRRARDEGANALLTLTDPLTLRLRRAIADAATALGLPSMFESKPFVEEGGLASYGADLHELWRQGARYVDRILRGAQPSELPVEQANRFIAAFNLRTARHLGLTVPAATLALADEVIE
jgi:putative tryptophan/tyrosine transport system substrate-binding protein